MNSWLPSDPSRAPFFGLDRSLRPEVFYRPAPPETAWRRALWRLGEQLQRWGRWLQQ